MHMQRVLIPLLGALALGGCATVPDAIQGERYTQTFFPDQAIEESIGAPVRWGGTIVDTRPESDRTCVEVLARELDSNAHPERSDEDLGRFIACSPEFLDPEIYTSGRAVTAVGTLTEFQTGLIGEFSYRYPVVSADAIYLWPEREEHRYSGVYPAGFYLPYYGWGYPYGYSRYPFYRGSYIRLHKGGAVRSGDASNNTEINSKK